MLPKSRFAPDGRRSWLRPSLDDLKSPRRRRILSPLPARAFLAQEGKAKVSLKALPHHPDSQSDVCDEGALTSRAGAGGARRNNRTSAPARVPKSIPAVTVNPTQKTSWGKKPSQRYLETSPMP